MELADNYQSKLMAIHYNCPTCGKRVWVHWWMFIVKGAPCFQCIGNGIKAVGRQNP